MSKPLIYFLATFFIFTITIQNLKAQKKDSTILITGKVTTRQTSKSKKFPKRNSFFNNIFKKVRSSIVVSKQDSINKSSVLNAKSVVPFIEYQGKVIRSVKIKELGFDKIFTDTSKRFNNWGNRVLNKLHYDTYDWVIRDNLFIGIGERINPYKLSDNERYLRSLEFIQDARIIVKPTSKNADSVDLEIITKDLFSITGSLDFSGTNRQKFSVAETNFAGAGQKVQITGLRDLNRNPVFGYNFLYSKNSIAHTFVTGTLGYSRINSDPYGNDNVESFYLQLSRPFNLSIFKICRCFQP